MKNMRYASRILGRNRSKGQIMFSYKDYLEKVLKQYGIQVAKAVITSLVAHSRPSTCKKPQSLEEEQYMRNITYANVFRSVMYFMVSTRPDLAYVLSIFMSEPEKAHWLALKSLLK